MSDLSNRQAAAGRQGAAFEAAVETLLKIEGWTIVERHWREPEVDFLKERTSPSHHGDPSTSKRAAAANTPRAGSQRARVLKYLYDAAEHGATDYELGRALGILRTAAGTRRKQLEDDGLVRRTDRERETDYPHSMAMVHEITEAGRDVARRLP